MERVSQSRLALPYVARSWPKENDVFFIKVESSGITSTIPARPVQQILRVVPLHGFLYAVDWYGWARLTLIRPCRLTCYQIRYHLRLMLGVAEVSLPINGII